MKTEIPVWVTSAQNHLNEFYSTSEDNLFPMALGVLEEHGFKRKEFGRTVSDFLQSRDIKPRPSLEEMLKMEENKVKLIGMSHYFARKTIQTSYDVELPESRDGITNPLPFLSYTFGSLRPSDDSNAYQFLNGLRQLMAGPHNKPRQRMVMLAINDVLPSITSEYEKELSKIQGKKGSELYNTQKGRLDSGYQRILGSFIIYLNNSINLNSNISLPGFHQYLASGSRSWDKIMNRQ